VALLVLLAACTGTSDSPTTPTTPPATAASPSTGGYRWVEDKSLYQPKPGDRNIGKRVAPEHIEQVQACQQSANIVIDVKFDNTVTTEGFNPPEVLVGSRQKLPNTGIVRVVTKPANYDVVVKFDSGVVSWASRTRGLTFCELIEEPVYLKTEALKGLRFTAWGDSGAYRKRHADHFGNSVIIYGNLPGLPPGPHTGTTTEEDGRGYVG
jgi:hypothetical protein